MRKILLLFTFVILLASLASADIIVTQQPEDLYNMGDIINLPIKVKTVTSLNDFFSLSIICNGQETQVHKEFVALLPGEEKQILPQIPLILSFTGKSTASCSLKALLGEEYIITNDFEISDIIEITIKEKEKEFNPGEDIILEGDAKKSNGDFVNGFVDLTLQAEGLAPISISDTVKNGYFFANFSLPADTPAAKYSVQIYIYEKDFQDQITNQGSSSQTITIKQVPTNLELILENPNVEPGTALNIKAILHDQTGESIKATSTIVVEDDEGNILEQTDTATDENFEFFVEYNQVPDTWFISANSGILEAEADFDIISKEAVSVEIVNKTVLITNIGNVEYNKSVLVKIGEQPVNIETNLEVDERQKFILEAPDGEYNILVTTNEGEEVQGAGFLTGKAINVREAGLSVGRFFTNPIVWIFLIIILAFVASVVFRKGLKRTIIGHRSNFLKKKQEQKSTEVFEKKSGSLIVSKNPAQLSLSIKGEKQDSSVVALSIKNMKELKDSNADDALQKIVNLAEEHKSATYENQDNIFFILAPTKTKTFKNEKMAINIANYSKEVLTQYNKLAKQKIDFGIAVNHGIIVAKQEDRTLKFMSMGTLITSSKKISSLAEGDVLLSKAMKEKLMTYAKTEKVMKGKIEVYKIKEIKKENTDNKKFLTNFVEKLEKDKKK